MTAVEIFLKLVAVCLLAGYLGCKPRQQRRPARRAENPAEWTGQTIDASRLMPAIRRVRYDYVAAQQHRPQSVWHQMRLLKLAGEAIRRLAYFRNRHGDEEAARN